MSSPTLGERLRARRTGLGLTLAEVAQRAGLSLPYISNLERSFVRTRAFVQAVERLAEQQAVATNEMRERLIVAMATAPRRSGQPTDEDWRWLLDVYRLILDESQ